MFIGALDALLASGAAYVVYEKYGAQPIAVVAACSAVLAAPAALRLLRRRRLRALGEKAKLRALIIGAGPSGIAAGIKCKELGVDFVVVEASAAAGGTWVNNTYPGCACDVSAYFYHYSFAEKNDWSCPFPSYKEIAAYFAGVAEKYGVHEKTKYEHKALRASWEASEQVWTVRVQNLATSEEFVLTANFLVSACGQLRVPAEPNFDTAKFKGKLMHSAKWDASCSLSGKKVAVVGTGATSLQIVPAICKEVKELVVFQRTPCWVTTMNKNTNPVSHFLVRHSYLAYLLGRFQPYFSGDAILFNAIINKKAPAFLWRAFKNEIIRQMKAQFDPARMQEMEEKLIPNYPLGRKRLGATQEYLPALMQPHVRVETNPVAHLYEGGVATKLSTGVKEEAFDTVILATGFKTGSYNAPCDIIGAQGKTLHQTWADGGNGPQAYLGISVPHFPNFFMYYGPGTNLGTNSIIAMIECQMCFMGNAMEAVIRQKAKSIDLTEEAFAKSVATYNERIGQTVWADDLCTDGKGNTSKGWYGFNNNWYGTVWEYWGLTQNLIRDHWKLE